MRILISADYVVGYQDQEHRLLSPGCVLIENDLILDVCESCNSPVDQHLHFPGCVVTPGFVNVHLHAGGLGTARLYADSGRPDLLGAGYLEYGAPADGAPSFTDSDVGGTAALAEALRSGCTTVVEIGGETGVSPEHLVRAARQLGLRLYTAPGFRSARYATDAGGRLVYRWDAAAGDAAFEAAVAFIEALAGDANGRVRGMLFPLQADTCTAELLQRTMTAASRLDVPVQIHAAQSLVEVHEMLRREGCSPLAWLGRLGVLRPRTIVAHAIFHGSHPWTPYLTDDVALLAGSGAAVAHCPVAMARRGLALHTFRGYARAGIRMALGTDTFPRDMMGEMRWAAYLGRIGEADVNAVSAWDVFEAATVGGADALGRGDLGRLAVGAKADVIAVNLRRLHFGPVFDPVAALVAAGTATDVTFAMVDGAPVVQDGVVRGVDEAALCQSLEATAHAAWHAVSQRDWRGRSADSITGLAGRRWQQKS